MGTAPIQRKAGSCCTLNQECNQRSSNNWCYIFQISFIFAAVAGHDSIHLSIRQYKDLFFVFELEMQSSPLYIGWKSDQDCINSCNDLVDADSPPFKKFISGSMGHQLFRSICKCILHSPKSVQSKMRKDFNSRAKMTSELSAVASGGSQRACGSFKVMRISVVTSGSRRTAQWICTGPL